jgi:hypothetical protein
MADFFEEQAKRLFGLGELEGEALEVLRLIVRQTERGENLDADLAERARAIVTRYDKAMMRGHEAPGGDSLTQRAVRMVGKRVQFDDETWEAIQAVSRRTGKSVQELASTAFTDLLAKHNQPVGFKAALETSVSQRTKVRRAKKR